MLVVTRKLGETVILDLGTGDTIQVTIVQIKGNQIRLGIKAPEYVPIFREEIYDEARGKKAPTNRKSRKSD